MTEQPTFLELVEHYRQTFDTVHVPPTALQQLNKVTKNLQVLFHRFLAADPGLAYVFQMAECYRLGVYPTIRPHNALATQLYDSMLELPLHAIMEQQVKESKLSMLPPEDFRQAALHLPEEWGQRVLQILRENGARYTSKLESTLCERKRTERRNAVEVHQQQNEQQQQDWDEEQRQRWQQRQDLDAQRLGADAQNVHDHSVVVSVRDKIAKVYSEYEERDQSYGPKGWGSLCKRRIYSSLGRAAFHFWPVWASYRELLPHVVGIHVAIQCLQSVKYDGYACSEQELMCAVLWKIRQQESELQRSLTVTLGMQLSSVVEYGVPVCHTGRVTRIISALQYLDLRDAEATNKSVCTANDVRAEVLTLAAKVRTTFLETCDEETKTLYSDGDEGVAKEIHTQFLTELNKVYKDLLSVEVLQKFEQESVDYF